MRELETARLCLRPVRADDQAALFKIWSEPEVSRKLITPPQSIEEFEPRFSQMVELSWTLGMWCIIHKSDGRLIGRCGYYPCSVPPVGTPELAYLLSRAYWGLGLATEAARRCVDYAFSEQAWPEVVAMVRLGNVASTRVLHKLGMEPLRRIEVRGVAANLYRLQRSSCPKGETPEAAAERRRARGAIP